MNKKTFCLSSSLCLFLLLLQVSSYAQSVKVDGEIRTRAEYRSGFQNPLADTLHSATIGSLRSRLNVTYSDNKIKAKLTLQDARTYGQTGINNTNNSLGLYEAWGEYLFTPDFSASLGRQSLEYDDKRLFSAANWSNTGNSHDLLLLKYETKTGTKAHLGAAWNNGSDVLYESAYTVNKSYKMMTYIWLSKSFGKLDATALWINDGFQRGTTPELLNKLSYRNTVGGNLGLKNKTVPYSFYATAYYQFGHNTKDKSLRGYLLALKNQYSITTKWSATLGVDYFSGSKSDLESGKDRTFNKLYGVNHSFNGSMEYWATLPAQGLFDLYGGITFKPNSKFNIDATFHSFSLTQELNSTDKKNIGSELDITANYTIAPEITIQGGWSAYFKTDQTDIVKKQVSIDTKFPHWAYIMISFKPTFLSKK